MELLEIYPFRILQPRKQLRIKVIFIFFKITLTKIIMRIFIYKNKIYLLQSDTNQSFQCKYSYVQIISYLIQNNRLLVFKTHGLYCRE